VSGVYLLHDLLDRQCQVSPDATALIHRTQQYSYASIAAEQDVVARGLSALGIRDGYRVGIFLGKCVEFVVTAFATSKAGGCFVPINPVLKPAQVVHILNDCSVQVLVTSPERLIQLTDVLGSCLSVTHVVVVGGAAAAVPADITRVEWGNLFCEAGPLHNRRRTDGDMAAILYTSGSTGLSKGVVVSHRNLVAGATSVASYLENRPQDRLLAALPLSFDAGFSQITTAFTVGAAVVLLEYLTPYEVVRTMGRCAITGMTAVPPLWTQLSRIEWPEDAAAALRYFANTGGKLPLSTLQGLRTRAPRAKPFLMYGLTEAFRSTYLPPEEIDRRPHSIGKAIPNQEVLILRPDGSRCGPREPGELVHRGSTVALGYWGDPERTAERFRPLQHAEGKISVPEMAVFSGDTVEMDEDGFLFFLGREDEMIKSSGYRISPVEIEEAAYATGQVAEVAAFGLPDEVLGQAIEMEVLPASPGSFDLQKFSNALSRAMPGYMQPSCIHVSVVSLPRNANGKLDRKLLARHYESARETNIRGVRQ